MVFIEWDTEECGFWNAVVVILKGKKLKRGFGKGFAVSTSSEQPKSEKIQIFNKIDVNL